MKKLFLILVLFLVTKVIIAQEVSWRCATAEMNRLVMENDPQARANWENLQKFIDEYIKENQGKKDEQVYVIPVVFHIVHNYGPENISKEQINDQIRILNEDYRKLNPDTVDIIPPFKQLATDSRIEFRLAQLDPNGNCTDGVTRTVSTQTYNGGEEIKQIAPSWPRAKYLNVWVVNRIPGGVAGYAYYPGTVPDGMDGILITHSYVGSIGTASPGTSRTLTHEIGHYLSLPHPWGSTNEPELASNCDIDDGIEDTPNTIGHTSCNLWAVTCGSLDNVQNYMEYSYCPKMFTHGQGARMRAVLNSSASQRNNLWTEANLIATGTNDPNFTSVCEPIADWKQNFKVACVDTEIYFSDLSYGTNSISEWNWEFEGGIPATSSEQNVTVVYPNPGKYGTNLYVSNSVGSSSKYVPVGSMIYSSSDAVDLPFYYDFESSYFPYLEGVSNNDFLIFENGFEGWQLTSDASVSGLHSISIDNTVNEKNTLNWFFTPLMSIDSSMFPITVNFKLAYAKAESGTNDLLKAYYSLDCGKTWLMRFYKVGNQLKTTDDYYPSGGFIPSTSEWRDEEFVINKLNSAQCNSLRLKFEVKSGGGSNLYIDDINVRSTPFVSIESKTQSMELCIYPNPIQNELYIAGVNDENVYLTITDITGRVLHKNIAVKPNSNIAYLFSNVVDGNYFIQVETANGIVTKRIVKQ